MGNSLARTDRSKVAPSRFGCLICGAIMTSYIGKSHRTFNVRGLNFAPRAELAGSILRALVTSPLC
jgi:hypothetical protein